MVGMKRWAPAEVTDEAPVEASDPQNRKMWFSLGSLRCKAAEPLMTGFPQPSIIFASDSSLR